MKKSALLLCFLSIVSVGNLFAQRDKNEKQIRKEFMETALPVCIAELNAETNGYGMGGAVDAKGYCTCMLENLIDSYTLDELAQIFVGKDEAEMMMGFFENEANYAKTMECMRQNVKDEDAMKQFVLTNSFGIESCTAGIVESGLENTIDAEGYCSCMFQRLDKEFTLDEILNEATYETEKFKVMAMECVLANTKE